MPSGKCIWLQYWHKDVQPFYFCFQKKHPDAELVRRAQAGNNSDQPTIQGFFQRKSTKYPAKHTKQTSLNNGLTSLIAGDLLPLSLVDSPRFRRFMENADENYAMPSRKHLSTTMLMKRKDELKSAIISQLHQVEYVSVTLDLWSNRLVKSYLGLTGHFVLHDRLQSVMLACKRFRGRHNAQNISEAYLVLATSFAIEDKVSDVVTDSAANMMKAFRDFSLPGYEPAHSEDTPNNVDDSDSNDSNDSDSDDDSGDTSDPTDNGVYDFLPGHHPCFAHTLQLTVKDGLKGAGAALNRLLAKASKLVSHVRKSTIAAEELEGETRLQTAMDTRWNSQLIMIRSILSIPEQKMIATESIHPALLLTTYERSVLKELCDMLKPFEDATLYA